MALSQAQVIGLPRVRSWDDYEHGCHATFGGGYHEEAEREIFRHGMSTVFNLLRGEFPSAEVCAAAPAMRDELLRLRNKIIAYLEDRDSMIYPDGRNDVKAIDITIQKATATT